MRYLLFLFLLIPKFANAQNEKLIDLIFTDRSNFNFIENLYGKLPKEFLILEKTAEWNPRIFYIENLVVDAELLQTEHHSYHSSYLFKDKIVDATFSQKEKKKLGLKAQNLANSNCKLKRKNYRTIAEMDQDGFYFEMTEPLFSSNILLENGCCSKP